MTQDQPQPRCILFLDFDGVTHPDPHEAEELFTRLPLIEEVLRGFAACMIVISSNWRDSHPLEEMREFFAPCPGCAPLLTNTNDNEPNGWWQAGRVPYRRGRVSGSTQLWDELKKGAWCGSATGGGPGNRNA
jgi:hypothetical protein